MKEYDVIVIGSGCGMIIVDEAMTHGAKVALVDKGARLGGTCLNYGCIPSKMLIHVANRVVELRKARELGVKAKLEGVDFGAVMSRMRKSRDKAEKSIREGIKQTAGLDFYAGAARFIADYTLEVNGEQLKGDRIFIASGSRPFVPPIKGLTDISFLTSDSVLELKERPKSLVIIGGGYIGVEYAHFFEAMGTKVTIIEMADRIMSNEDHEITDLILTELRKRMDIRLNTRVVETKRTENGVAVVAEAAGDSGLTEISAQKVLFAIGRSSNADLLEVNNTGVEVDKQGFIKVNDYLETNKKNIFTVGDANGQQMFTHIANREAEMAIENALYDSKETVNRDAAPHAAYTYPPIASVGMTEEAARQNHQVVVSRTRYYDVAKGEAMMEKTGFAKIILDKGTGHILGFHIIGPQAPVLIQEVVNAITSGGQGNEINQGIHIHPALSELIQVTLNDALAQE